MNKVSKMYSIFSAKWYDPFKVAWNFIIGRKAEKDLLDFIKININEHKDVLELGCGTALNLEKIDKHGIKFKNYLGIDFTESMLNIARGKFADKTNVKFERHDITKLNNLDKKFDVILCTWVLSHLQDPIEFVNNTQKHLKPGGVFFLVFYTKSKWYLNSWFNPIAKYLFFADSLDKKIIKDFKNVTSVETTTVDLVTVVKIKKDLISNTSYS